MTAGITSSDSMLSVRQTPWHGLGAVLDQPPATLADAIERSGLGWRVEREPIAIDRGDVATVDDWWLPRCEEIPGWWANVRQDTRQVLGIVGERYRIVQNIEAFQFVDQLIGSAMHFETAGSLHGGRRVWVLAQLPEHIEVGGDPVRPYVLLMNSHDGSTAVVAASTPIRVVCQNTLNWGLERARQKYSIRHTEKIREHVHQARRVLDLSIDYYKQFKRAGDQLATERFTQTQLRQVLDELYPSGIDDTASDRTRRSREQTKHRIIELFGHGETQGNAPGTKWAAINAIIEHADLDQTAQRRIAALRPRPGRRWAEDPRARNGGGRQHVAPRRLPWPRSPPIVRQAHHDDCTVRDRGHAPYASTPRQCCPLRCKTNAADLPPRHPPEGYSAPR